MELIEVINRLSELKTEAKYEITSHRKEKDVSEMYQQDSKALDIAVKLLTRLMNKA